MDDKKIYNAAMYCRISRDDGDKIESDSISNQKELIAEFVKNKPDINVVSVRVDDGYTGVNFDRPSFKEMLEDAKNGKINCIIVKDLSRFARNYIDSEKYIESIFPFMGIRFIAINDNYDSISINDNDSIIVPFKNLLNDAYCRDISVKTRSNLDIKRKNGEYISPFAPYGYKKSETDKNKIVIDDIAAEIVRNIFYQRMSGMSCYEIAKRLNERGIPTPSEYKKLQGMAYKSGFKLKEESEWTHNTIMYILKNPVYIGTLEQGKTTTPNHKIKKRFKKPREEWNIASDNHEPIISKEIFETVNSLFGYDTKTAQGAEKVYPFSGKLFCSDCGGNLIRKKTKRNNHEYVYYSCSTKLKDKNKCTSHRINEKDLEECVLLSIRSHIDRTCDVRNAIELISNIKLKPSDIEIADKELKNKEKVLEEYKSQKAALAETCIKGIISKKDFNEFSRIYDEKITAEEKNIEELKENIHKLLKNSKERFSWIEDFIKYGNITAINRNAVVVFIDRIIVHEGNKIEIIFNHRDEYTAMVDFIENSYDVICDKLNEET